MQEQLTPDFGDYELIDTGDFEKLERFGRYVTRRPEPQAIWRRTLSEEEWRRTADAAFLRDARSDERGEWRLAPKTPDRWTVEYSYRGMRLRMRLGLTSFKHVGIFPEQAANWNFIYDECRKLAGDSGGAKVLNLFAYTGGATLAARAAGAELVVVKDAHGPGLNILPEELPEFALESCAGAADGPCWCCVAPCCCPFPGCIPPDWLEPVCAVAVETLVEPE